VIGPLVQLGLGMTRAAGGETGPSGLPLDTRLVVRVTRYVFVRHILAGNNKTTRLMLR
jgi:hypothetical protein